MNAAASSSGRLIARRFTALACWLLAAVCAHAQSAATGRITGRVFNPATQEFVRNAEVSVAGTDIVAFSDADGSYLLPNVPAGAVTVAVAYTGYERATATLNVAAGATATRDFELRGATFSSAAAGAKSAGEIVQLEKFVVSNEREGNAKAIMEQRAALNMKSVVAADNFGDITGGNVGEFVKYLPGVVLDYVDADARAVRLGGLDPKYAGVSIDGMRMASAASAVFTGATRQFEFEQSSITSIESIEINKTLTASLDADAPAGSMNMRSKNAFERKGREITFTTTLTANPYDLTTARTPGPGDGEHRKIRPGFVFTYADSFQQRFGVQLSLSHNSLYNEQAGITHTYDFATANRAPVINNLTFRDNPKITTRAAFGLNLDYKILPGLVASLRTQGSHFDDEINARQVIFRANTADIDPASTFTNIITRPTANANTRLETIIGHSDKWNDTATYSPKLEFKRNDLLLTLGGGYSRSRTHYEDRRSGYWATTNNRVTRMSWTATRSNTRDGGWQIRQLTGRPWNDIASFNRDDANANNIGTSERTGRSQVWQGYFDAKKAFNLGIPVIVQAGVKSRLTVYDLWKTGALTWTFVGPARSQLAATTQMAIHTYPVFDPRQGDNVPSLGIPIANATLMYRLFQSDPGQFTENAVGNFTALNASPRAVKEQVDAGYVEFNTRWRQLRLNLGARRERTRTIGRVFDLIPNRLVTAAGYTAGTIPFVTYQYRGFERSNRYGGYEHTFFSGGAKYSITKNLVAQLSASQSIGRPDYNNLAGALTINDTNFTVSLPNPDLKPETSDKFFAGLQYYIEPAGTLSVSAYRLNVKNMGTSNTQITAEQAGLADDPEYVGYTFFQPTNLSGTRKIKGLEVEYSQQLVFLPGWARGFSVFGSLTRAIPDLSLVSVVPKAVNGGLRYSNHKFNLQLRTTWASARLTSIAATQTQWQTERIMFDVSGGWKLGPRYEVTLSGRNILNSPITGFVNQPGLMRTNFFYGAVWTLGLRGRW
ncbi:MAG: TonB-dependent receptor [Verrucomicrobia bacterium]|nr:TonB-dependent receptor [Verrucomicrobiota bacterium]